jgi:hypothetical protein
LGGSRFFGFLDFQATELGLAKEFKDQSSKGVFLYFHVFLPGNVFLWAQKSEKFTK